MEYNSMDSAPLDGTRVRVYNPVTGWYVSQHEEGEWPLHNWKGCEGIWYPVPIGWLPFEIGKAMNE